MRRSTRVRAGWSRTPIPITPEMSVLDIGSGSFPNARADVLCERELEDDRHRAGRSVVIDRPLVCADAAALPFRDRAFDFVIASHVAEHVEDPVAFCDELARVARAGYVETPSPCADYMLDEEYHVWRVGIHDGALRFRTKGSRSRVMAFFTDQFYMVFYAAQDSCARPTRNLPRGALGKAMAFGLKAVGFLLNRMGVMHTRYLFTPVRPMRCVVERR